MKIPLVILNLMKIKVVILLIPFLMSTLPLAFSQPHSNNFYCDGRVIGNNSTNSTYQNNLNSLFPNLINQSSITIYASVGEGIDKVYMIYSCRGDLNSEECQVCVKEAAESITETCQIIKKQSYGIMNVWFGMQIVQYSPAKKSPHWFGIDYSTGEDPNPQLAQVVADNITGLIEQAAYNDTKKGFATGQDNIALDDDVFFLV